MKKRTILILTVLMVLTLSLVGCGSQTKPSADGQAPAQNADNSWNQVADRGELLIGMCPEYAPFSTINASGAIEGFDADFSAGVGKALGAKTSIKNTPWEGLIAGLINGEYDVVISCISPQEAEQAGKAVEFSKPYYNLSEIIVVAADNTSITSKEDLAGKIVGVQDNCSSSKAAETLQEKGIQVKELKRYERNSGTLADLQAGRLDAVIVGEAFAATQAKKNPAFKVIYDPVASVEIVVVTNKGASLLLEKINEGIDTVKNNGDYAEAEGKWLVTDK